MSSNFILENDKAIVEISTDAAQIYSFKSKVDGLERIYDGNPEFWKQRNPILFPQVGNTYNKTQVFKGKEYHMGNHGFTRYSEFFIKEKIDNNLTLYLVDNEKTYNEYYPYHFRLEVNYKLIDTKLIITYSITNEDEEKMPFGFGLHPAFMCPLKDDEKFEDYYIEFASLEDSDTEELKLIKDHKLHLNYKIFDKYKTIMFENLNSNSLSLTNGKHGVKVNFVGYPYLALWTFAKNAPFVCIEPWLSLGDNKVIDEAKEFKDRKTIINLKSKKTFVTSYSIELI